MANPVRGQVPVSLEGLKLTLEFTIDALCQLEDRLDETATAIFARVTKGDNSLSFLRCLLWAALLENHPGYSEKAAGELIRLRGGNQLAGKIVEAFFAAWPKPEVSDPPRPRPVRKTRTAAPAGTGPGSSRAGANTD